MKKILFLALATLATLQAAAQWRIGANVGGSYNHYVIDKHYFDDYQYKDPKYNSTLALQAGVCYFF